MERDIVERLRDQGKDAFAKQYSLGMFKLCDEAAVEIDRLRKALETIRDRLWRDDEPYDERIGDLKYIARETLDC